MEALILPPEWIYRGKNIYIMLNELNTGGKGPRSCLKSEELCLVQKFFNDSNIFFIIDGFLYQP